MFVELVYDKRNFDGLPGAKDIILGELTKRVHRIFPDADVRVKPMMTLPAINTDIVTLTRQDTHSPPAILAVEPTYFGWQLRWAIKAQKCCLGIMVDI
ncbi:DinI-like family protein [Citrobacter freundii]